MRQGLKEGTEQLICDELMHANKSFRAFASTHEGYAVLMEELEPIQARRHELEKDIPAVMEILRQGSIKARETAAQTLSEVKHAMKIDYFA